MEGRSIGVVVVAGLMVAFRAWYLIFRSRDCDIHGGVRIIFGVCSTLWIMSICVTNGLLPRPFGEYTACTLFDIWVLLIPLAGWQHAATLRFISLWRTQHTVWRDLNIRTRRIPSNHVIIGAFMVPSLITATVIELKHGSLQQWEEGDCTTPAAFKAPILMCIVINFAASIALQWVVARNDAYVKPPAQFRHTIVMFRVGVFVYCALGVTIALINLLGHAEDPVWAVVMWWLAEAVVVAVMLTAFGGVSNMTAWNVGGGASGQTGGRGGRYDGEEDAADDAGVAHNVPITDSMQLCGDTMDVGVDACDIVDMVYRLERRIYNLAFDRFLYNSQTVPSALAPQCHRLSVPPTMECVRETLEKLREYGRAGLGMHITATAPLPTSLPPHTHLLAESARVLIHATNLWVLFHLERAWMRHDMTAHQQALRLISDYGQGSGKGGLRRRVWRTVVGTGRGLPPKGEGDDDDDDDDDDGAGVAALVQSPRPEAAGAQ